MSHIPLTISELHGFGKTFLLRDWFQRDNGSARQWIPSIHEGNAIIYRSGVKSGETMDRTNIEQLYKKFGPSVLRRARNILRNEQDAQEALQEIFLTVLSKGHTFRGESATMTWLYSITTNLCLNRLRNTKRRGELLDQHKPQLKTTTQPHPELIHQVSDLLRKVPEPLAQVAIYYYYDAIVDEAN